MTENNKSVEDLAADESFQNWVNHTVPADIARWENWIAAHPHLHDKVEEAVAIIKVMQSLRRKEVAHRKKDLIIEDLHNRLHHAPASPKPRIFIKSSFFRAAAAVLLVTMAGYTAYYYSRQSLSRFHSEYGENKNVRLPDGSEVSLNANSGLTINKSWDQASSREVWLDGEAFFSVTHKRSGQRFIVHTDNGDVIVIGTKFNVFNRRGKTQVVLSSGKVKVVSRNSSDTLVMEPGQMVELTAGNTRTKKSVDVARFTSWRQNTLSFEDASLLDVAALIKDNYGYEVVWSDEKLKSIRFTYQLVGKDLDLLLATMSEALDLDIQKKDNLIYISSK